jgi:hypothetical protein
MKKYLFLLIRLSLLGVLMILVCPCGMLFGGGLMAQSGEITGAVYLPAVQKDIRNFRGRLYRNRLSSAKDKTDQNEILKSPFIDVIISAHPQKFTPELKPLREARVFQKDAAFIPRVIPITPGTVVQFINKDVFFHNVFSITPGSQFNIGRRPTNVIVERKITRLGEIKLFCDIHAQMNAIMLCLDTPYFTRADAEGKFSIAGLPAGPYTIKVYHPDFTEVSETVEIPNGDTIRKDFILNR